MLKKPSGDKNDASFKEKSLDNPQHAEISEAVERIRAGDACTPDRLPAPPSAARLGIKMPWSGLLKFAAL